MGLDHVAYGLLVAEIEQGDSSASRLLTVHLALVAETLLRCGSASQIQIWLPRIARGETICAFGLTEPGHGSDAAGIETTYTVKGNEFRISGRKRWITFSGIADLILVTPVAATKYLRSAIATAPALQSAAAGPWPVGRATSCEIVMNEVVVGMDRLVGQPGQGFIYVANTALDHGRYSIAWSAVDSPGALNAMVSYARQRKRSARVPGTFQLVREMIAEAVARLYAKTCAGAGECASPRSPGAVIETTIASTSRRCRRSAPPAMPFRCTAETVSPPSFRWNAARVKPGPRDNRGHFPDAAADDLAHGPGGRARLNRVQARPRRRTFRSVSCLVTGLFNDPRVRVLTSP
jgi:alkylation response protein AidB-like acyl-CoA dehydrogenase